jgi:hypothetical protein
MWSLWRNKDREGAARADQALRDAKRSLRDIEERGPEVAQVAKALRDFREKNHFAEGLEAMIRQQKGPLNDA